MDVRERADAARNRSRILEAAERLFAEQGIEHVSMDAVAGAAGVGKGTLFRRFGDRQGLARAVVARREEEFRRAVLAGPPPLGPGAPPAERLCAYMDQAAALGCAANARMLAYEMCSGRSGYREESYRLWHGHVAGLLAEARPDIDSDVLAHALLASLDGALIHHLVADEGMPASRVRSAVVALARSVLESESGRRLV